MKIRALILLAGVLLVHAAAAALNGTNGLNDASRVIKCGSKYFWYSTGGGVKMIWTSSPQSGEWQAGPDVFPVRPSWWADYSAKSTAWAPDVIWCEARKEYRLYYCVSAFGTNNSAIGLAVNATLDPEAANYRWIDKGIVLSSHAGVEKFNALDPCPVRTPANEWYLAYGSYFSGMHLIRLTEEGLRDPAITTQWNLARNTASPNNQLEAPAIYPGVLNGVDGFWLFVNWGSGLGKSEKATYNVRVGWSVDVHGPYKDKKGVDLWDGGGFLMMPSPQKFPEDGSTRIGRGHVGIIAGEKLDGTYPDWISYSYWLEGQGKRFGLQRLVFDADGWPDDGSPLQP